MAKEVCLRFVPSDVEGLPEVTEVVVRPDRLELLSAGQWVIFRFSAIARWPRPAWMWRLLSWVGLRPRWLPVGDRDWFHPPARRFFAFYTKPQVVVYMPDEPLETDYSQTMFRRVQEVIGAGGFGTFDLG
jgi:hypothetical protein